MSSMQNLSLLQSKLRAAGIHLLISALVASVILLLMFYVWYPNGYFDFLGGGKIFYLITAVDVCLGPLLTFVVYKVGKKTLKFDLSVIGALQLAALLYGVHVMFAARPVFNVFAIDLFKVTLASELTDTDLLAAKRPEWRSLSITGPIVVAALGPTDPKEREEIMFAAVAGKDWNHFPKLYVDYQSQRDEVLKHAKPLSELRKKSSRNPAVIDHFIAKQSKPESSFVYLPIVYAYIVKTAVLDSSTAEFVAIIDATDQ